MENGLTTLWTGNIVPQSLEVSNNKGSNTTRKGLLADGRILREIDALYWTSSKVTSSASKMISPTTYLIGPTVQGCQCSAADMANPEAAAWTAS